MIATGCSVMTGTAYISHLAELGVIEPVGGNGQGKIPLHIGGRMPGARTSERAAYPHAIPKGVYIRMPTGEHN